MGEAGPVIVALVIDEHLGLVLESPEGRAVDDPVPVTLKGRTVITQILRVLPATRFDTFRRISGQVWSFHRRFPIHRSLLLRVFNPSDQRAVNRKLHLTAVFMDDRFLNLSYCIQPHGAEEQMPHEILSRYIHPNISRRLGSASKVCVLSGRDIFATLGKEKSIVMACNPRIAHVIPGIMRAAEELDALVIFELTATEGGLDGGYTGQTPEIFVQTLLEQAERHSFTKPFAIHADHITVKDSSETLLIDALRLIEAQRAAGFTSFALDASFN